MVSLDFRRQLEGFGLTTANILYRLPDHPGILQNYIWQEHDLHPHFPGVEEIPGFLVARTRRPSPFGDRRPLPADQACGVQGGRRRVPAELTARRADAGLADIRTRQTTLFAPIIECCPSRTGRVLFDLKSSGTVGLVRELPL